jgi:hypothetical protein
MRSWLFPLVAAVLVAAGCSKKSSAVADDPSVKVCQHVVDVCGKNANLEMCVASARAMRQRNPKGADEVDTCAMSKTSCQDISLCTTTRSDNTVRTSFRRMKEAKEKLQNEAASQAPAPAAPAAPAAPPASK